MAKLFADDPPLFTRRRKQLHKLKKNVHRSSNGEKKNKSQSKLGDYNVYRLLS